MERLSLETQTLYAELQEQLTALEAQRSIGSLPGGFTTKKVKGETYYYFQYAFHKLIVMQERPATEHVKRNKDLRQASLLINLLADERPGDLQLAWDNLTGQGESWEKKATRGYLEMQKLFPETPNLDEIAEL